MRTWVEGISLSAIDMFAVVSVRVAESGVRSCEEWQREKSESGASATSDSGDHPGRPTMSVHHPPSANGVPKRRDYKQQ